MRNDSGALVFTMRDTRMNNLLQIADYIGGAGLILLAMAGATVSAGMALMVFFDERAR